MVVDIKLTRTEYKVLNILSKIEVINNTDYNEFCEKYYSTASFISSTSPGIYVDIAGIYLFKTLKKKLKLNEEMFKFTLARLDEKGCVFGEYHRITPNGLAALENHRSETISKRIPILISILAVIISALSLIKSFFFN